MPKMQNPNDLQVGDWWAACCLNDLERIQSADDLATMRKEARDFMFRAGWSTCAEAVDDLVQECGPQERQTLASWYRRNNDPVEALIADEIDRHIKLQGA